MVTATWKDLRALVAYGDKEKCADDAPVVVSLTDAPDMTIRCAFSDEEKRHCVIVITDKVLGRRVQLIKYMDLHTRLEEK
jgi:hypothetical protein